MISVGAAPLVVAAALLLGFAVGLVVGVALGVHEERERGVS